MWPATPRIAFDPFPQITYSCAISLHPLAPNTVYRRAILQALDYSSVQNFNSRANIDWIRHHTKEILAEHEKPDVWNDAMFLQTLKSVVNSGEVELCANIQAELSPTYKRKRADSLQKKLEQHCLNAAKAPDTAPNLPEVHPHHVIFAFKDPKEPPHRPREHEKWKIIPKRVFDRTT